MSKATQDKMNELHGMVADVLKEQIANVEEETVFTEEGLEVGTGKFKYTASPATIASAIKFLKDNDTTCDIEQDENMNGLRDLLSHKQKRSRLQSVKEAATLE